MSQWRRKLKYSFLIFLVKSLIWISSWMPRKLLHGVFSLLAKAAFFIVKKEREKTIRNIQIGYPEKSHKEARKMAREVFVNLGKNYSDLAKGLSIRTKEQYRRVIRIEGEEHIEAAFQKGKGVIGLGCHLGAFELYGTYLGLHYPTVGVGAKLKNETLDQLVVENRTSRGIDYSHRGESNMKLIRALMQGKVAIMAIDQDVNRVKSVFVDFYGRKAATPIGVAVLAGRTGAAVVPMAMSLQNGKQVLTIRPEVELVSTGNEEADVLENTERFTSELEIFIKEYPTQWVWMHERWRTRPESEN